MIASVGKPVSFYPVFKLPEKRYMLTPQQKRFKKKLVTYNDVTGYGWVRKDSDRFYMSYGDNEFAWCLHYLPPKYIYHQSMATAKYKVAYIWGGKYELWYSPNKYFGRGQVKCGSFISKSQLLKEMEVIMNIVNGKTKGIEAFNANQQGINQYLATK